MHCENILETVKHNNIWVIILYECYWLSAVVVSVDSPSSPKCRHYYSQNSRLQHIK